MGEFFLGKVVNLPQIQHPRVAWEENPSGVEDRRCFYSEFFRFAAIYRWLGSFPVETSRFSRNLNFSWKSTITLMSVLSLPITTIFLWSWKRFGDTLEQLFSLSLTIFPLVNKILYLKNIPSLIKLIQQMDLIDVDSSLKERNVQLTKKDHRFIVCFGLVSCAIVTFPHSMVTSGPIPEVIFYHFLHCQWMVTSMAQSSIYYAICYQMNHFCDRYLSSLEQIADRPHDKVSEDLIEDHRILQAKLTTCVRLMDDAFGSWLAFVYITNCVKFLLYCYYSMYGIRRGEMGLTLLQMIWFLFFVYRPAVLTDHISRKNKKIMPYLVKMALKPFPNSTLFQINYFIRQLKFNVASVSAAGLADVSKEIITKSLSLFATSFVAVIQLEPQIQNLVTYLRRMINSTLPNQ